MLELRYNNETKLVTGWRSDPEKFGNLEREGHTVVILDIPIPPLPGEAYLFNELSQSLVENPEYILPEPPKSTHYAKVTGFNPTALEPLSVVRTWQGQDYPCDCFVTQDIVDAYTAGNLAIGDYVLIHFDDSGKQIAMMKIFKTW